MNKISGIYRIISPSEKIYVGQSINIYDRFRYYHTNSKTNRKQIKLFRSFLKYGIDNHIFEIIEECSIEKLNERERYWQEYYDVLGKNGLNCVLTTTLTKSGKQSKESILKRSDENHFLYGKTHTLESKEKMSISHKGKKLSLETKEKLSKIQSGEGNGFYNKKHTEKSKQKMSESAKNRNESEETKLSRKTNISKSMKGRKYSDEHKENIAKAKEGENNPMFGKTGINHPRARKVIQLDLNNQIIKIWDSLADISKEFNVSVGTISSMLRHNRKKCKFIPNYFWEYYKEPSSLLNN